jgi:hypothetical protein
MLIKQRLINEKRHAIQTAHAGGLEKADDIGKDLLSILSGSFALRAHVSADHQSELTWRPIYEQISE